MGNLFKSILKAAICITLSACIGLSLILCVYVLPDANLKGNTEDAARLLSGEGTYPNYFSFCHSQLDNWTDSIMIQNVSNEAEIDTVQRALLMPHLRGVIDGERFNPYDSLLALYGYGRAGEDGLSFENEYYSRYWHGYVVFLKPLLSVVKYSTIRDINLVLQTAITLEICFLLWLKNYKKLIIPYILTIAAMNPIVVAQSLQFSTITYIMGIATLLLLIFNDKMSKEQSYFFFLFAGIATSYMDFLTFPLLTFFIPYIVYENINGEKQFKEMFIDVVICAMFWGFGYVGMWAFKWIFASIFTNENSIAIALSSLTRHTSEASTNEVAVSGWQVIKLNLKCFLDNPIIPVIAIYCGIFGLISLFRKKLKLKNCFIYGMFSIVPFVWFVFASTHSYIHHWFTYREFVISVFALSTLVSMPRVGVGYDSRD